MRYTYWCEVCGVRQVRSAAVADRNGPQICDECGAEMDRDLAADMRSAQVRIPRHMMSKYDDEMANVRRMARASSHSTLGNEFEPSGGRVI